MECPVLPGDNHLTAHRVAQEEEAERKASSDTKAELSQLFIFHRAKKWPGGDKDVWNEAASQWINGSFIEVTGFGVMK